MVGHVKKSVILILDSSLSSWWAFANEHKSEKNGTLDRIGNFVLPNPSLDEFGPIVECLKIGKKKLKWTWFSILSLFAKRIKFRLLALSLIV